MKSIIIKSVLLISMLIISACASKFPTPDNARFIGGPENLTGQDIFNRTFFAHGGERMAELHNLNVSIDGEWKQLIRRIQPLVTDYKYRVISQERIMPRARVYSANYIGPAGKKSLFRTPNSVSVNYDNKNSTDQAVLSSTALTADSFHLFLLGPLSLEKWRDHVTRLTDKKINDVLHWRIHVNRIPGFGFSERDDIVLWVNSKNNLTSRVQITLEGHESTRGAHVEVDYLKYVHEQGYTFPMCILRKS